MLYLILQVFKISCLTEVRFGESVGTREFSGTVLNYFVEISENLFCEFRGYTEYLLLYRDQSMKYRKSTQLRTRVLNLNTLKTVPN